MYKDFDLNNPVRIESSILSPEQQLEHFKGCIYIVGIDCFYMPDGKILSRNEFDSIKGGRIFLLNDKYKYRTKIASEAFTQNQCFDLPSADRILFRNHLKNQSIINKDGYKAINTFVEPKNEFKSGDISQFKDFVCKLLINPTDQAILLSYLAAVVQYPSTKFNWCLLIQGVQGSGKTSLINILKYACGSRMSHIVEHGELLNKCNKWQVGKSFAGIQEIKTNSKWEALYKLKWLINNKEGLVRSKGEGSILADFRANYLVCSDNYESVNRTKDDKSFCALSAYQQEDKDLKISELDSDYIREYYEWLENEGYEYVAYFLSHYEIPKIYNPSTHCIHAPLTSVNTREPKNHHDEAREAIKMAIDNRLVGFRGGWISSHAVSELFKSKNINKTRLAYSKILKEIGYEKSEKLYNGQANIPIEYSKVLGTRPYLYVNEKIKEKESYSLNKEPGKISVMYAEDQKY